MINHPVHRDNMLWNLFLSVNSDDVVFHNDEKKQRIPLVRVQSPTYSFRTKQQQINVKAHREVLIPRFPWWFQ